MYDVVYTSKTILRDNLTFSPSSRLKETPNQHYCYQYTFDWTGLAFGINESRKNEIRLHCYFTFGPFQWTCLGERRNGCCSFCTHADQWFRPDHNSAVNDCLRLISIPGSEGRIHVINCDPVNSSLNISVLVSRFSKRNREGLIFIIAKKK